MNKYKVTRIVCGRTEACFISGDDIQDVFFKMPNHCWYPSEIVKIELVIETNYVVADFTEPEQ